jgi:muramoyltetrapeptide carboxypeptidase LdcA involved in peptidoglycan recycling
MRKPRRLRPGSQLVVISPAWGGPSLFPRVHESGLRNLELLGFRVHEYPGTRMDADKTYQNPRLRAEEVNRAFADPDIDGIITTIGGDDSARILKYLDLELIAANHKFFMGYSDITTINSWLNQHGLVMFNGPSVMAGFSQFASFDEKYQRYLRDYLFSPQERNILPSFEEYYDGYPDWAIESNLGLLNPPRRNDGPRFLQGKGVSTGTLFGGCAEVLEMLKGTAFWPAPDFWDGKILFLETSEEKPSIDYMGVWLRNYGVMEVFQRISGLLIGRARDYSDQEKDELDRRIIRVVRDEFGCSSLPVVTNLDFGHSDPQLILPLGIRFEIDADRRRIVQAESAFADE